VTLLELGSTLNCTALAAAGAAWSADATGANSTRGLSLQPERAALLAQRLPTRNQNFTSLIRRAPSSSAFGFPRSTQVSASGFARLNALAESSGQ
jgi:hypothetical protein